MLVVGYYRQDPTILVDDRVLCRGVSEECSWEHIVLAN